MMNLSVRGKSTLLVFSMLIAAPVYAEEQAVSVSVVNQLDPVLSYISQHKTLACALTLFAYGVKTRLKTKPKADYKLDQWRDDLQELLESFNVFDTKMYKQLVHLFDKYFVGLEFKREETTTRTKNDDGTVETLKGSKVVQKPFGLYGHFDAYVVKQMKDTVDILPVAVAFYLLLNEPVKSIGKIFTNATKTTQA